MGDNEPRMIVTLGPSCSAQEARRLLPDAEIRPPVEAGQIMHWGLRAGDVLLLIDGYFLQSRAVRHKEILTLLDTGVTVLGASSMGALRAAELSPYGMHGVGEVYRGYRCGRLLGDDEVTLVHSDTEHDYRAIGWALADFRDALLAARRSRTLDAEAAGTLLRCAAELPFTARYTATILGRAKAAGAPAEQLAQFHSDFGRPAGWVKYRDARRALRVADRIRSARISGARGGDTQGGGPSPAGLRYRGRPQALAMTSYLRAWSTSRAGHRQRDYERFVRAVTASADCFPRLAAASLLTDAARAAGAPGNQVPLSRDRDGLPAWPVLVDALHPLLPHLGLPARTSAVPARLLPLLRAEETLLPCREATVLLATRLWRADPRYDWLTPALGWLDGIPQAPAGAQSSTAVTALPDPRKATVSVLRRWGAHVPEDVLPVIRGRGLLDRTELLSAVRAGLIAPCRHDQTEGRNAA
ncbi:TfuA-like protein [Streptomyces sp. NPDC006386]|uniref:TfuA-like protein n=1 Tax=Streptomyces sp. NPDC006386 TaxID=3156762 RepID=UPI0033AA57E4